MRVTSMVAPGHDQARRWPPPRWAERNPWPAAGPLTPRCWGERRGG